MGLDTTHDAWHGAYSAFTRWRDEIAKAAGYAFLKSDGAHGFSRDVVAIDWGHIPERALMGDWSGLDAPKDPLMYLIAHSDCEGEIRPEQAAPLADALEALLPKLKGVPGGGHIGPSFTEKTKTFIAGLRRAVAANEPLEFH